MSIIADVMMVWHSFMLNPRYYLEDCFRQDMMSLWHIGMPWAAINASINSTNWLYNPGQDAVKAFESSGGCNWDNLNDSDNTWARRARSGELLPDGGGHADQILKFSCTECGESSSHDNLRAAKFVRDSENIVRWAEYAIEPVDDAIAIPMPGTILNMQGAMESAHGHTDPRLFPNHLLQRMINNGFQETGTDVRAQWRHMSDVREAVETALKDFKTVVGANNNWNPLTTRKEARIYIRKMMSRYWGNYSIFSLNLVGAVIRQGSFIEKMEQIGWLRSPTVMSTMDRLVQKYTRFFDIMSSRLGKVTVPTLDVDLLWHTNQLTPSNYYNLCLSNASPRTYMDHDDKIGEVKLHDAFLETTRIYQDQFKEPYSKCTCWYCESVRTASDSSIKHLLSHSSRLHEAEKRMLYARPGKSQGPHVSTHSVITPINSSRASLAKRASTDQW